MEKIRTIIVDDEPLARKGIRKLLEKEEQIEIIAECGNGLSAVNEINEQKPDLVFLDIQMPELGGFEVLKNLEDSVGAAVVFVTAFDQYAIEAFEVNAVDYLLKPFSDSRFKVTLDRVVSHIRKSKTAGLNEQFASLIKSYNALSNGGSNILSDVQPDKKDYQSKFMIKESGKFFFVDVSEIKWVEALDYYARIHTKKSTHIIRESLNNLENSLDPRQFLRIHRSSIVNVDAVKSFENNFKGEMNVILKDGTKLKMSRARKDILNSFNIRG